MTTTIQTRVHKGEKVTAVKDRRADAREYLSAHARTQSGKAMAHEHLRRAEKRLAEGKGISRLMRVAGNATGVHALAILAGVDLAADFPLLSARIATPVDDEGEDA